MKKLIFIIAFTTLVLLVTPFGGVQNLSISDLSNPDLSKIFFELRVPRVFAGFLVGAILSVCGFIYQLIFKNPLASPYTLGVSSGAALGASIAIIFTEASPISFSIIAAILISWCIYYISTFIKDNVSNQLLLAGVVITFFCSGMILLLQYMANFSEVFRITRWLMGNIEIADLNSIFMLSVSLLLLILFIVFKHKELALVSIDSEYAKTKGVQVDALFKSMFFVTSVSVAIVVSFCGPIGFVGIAVPYVVKKITGFSVLQISFVSLFLGGSLLVICDTFSRILASPAEIPVGIITAVFASPLVLMILIKKD